VSTALLPVFTVFDVETTGLDPRRGHRIIEIAGVRIEGGAIQSESAFHTLVNPEREIPWDAKQVNKLNDDEVASAPTIDQVLPQFLSFAEGSTLVAHNADFDMGFLEKEKEYCWGYVELPECLCTMRLSQALFPREFRHGLDIVGHRLGLSLPQRRHRALPDVLLTAQVLLKLMETGSIASLDELRRKATLRKLVA
jgi:DNA polymerase III epsilon subunit